MSVNARTAGGLAFLVVVAGLAWSWLRTSPEDRVVAAVTAAAEALSARATDPLAQVAALGRLRGHLTEDVVVEAGADRTVTGRDAAAGLWQRVRASADAVRVRVLDPQVVIAADGASADVAAVVEATFERGGVPERELREVQLRMVDRGGEWLVAGAVLVDAVTPPQ
ncbi:MAG: hypothetical protein AB7U83_11085 [Vicinamibacterales bacterium]